MMELVYLWIDGYRNLYDFGTLLNGKYKVEKSIDRQNGSHIQFSVKKVGDQYIFPQNVNIMAIVGKNGTGKSNVCNALAAIMRKHSKDKRKAPNWDYFDFTLPEKYCLIYKQDDKFKYVSYGINCGIKLSDGNIIQQNGKDDLFMCALFLPYLNLNEDKILEFPKYHIHELINAVKTDNYFYYDRFRIYDTSHSLRELFDIIQNNNIELFDSYENYVFKYYGYEFNIEEEFQWLNAQLENISKRLKTKEECNLISLLIESNEEIIKSAQESYFKDKKHLFKEILLPQACFSYAISINPSVLIYSTQNDIKKFFYNDKNNSNFCRNPKLFIDIYTKTIKHFKDNSKYLSLYVIDKYVDTNIIFNKYIALEKDILKIKNDNFLDMLTTTDGNLFKLKNEYLVPIYKSKEDVAYIKNLDELKVFRLNYYNENDSKKDSYSFVNLSSGEQRKLRFFADFISVLKNGVNTLLIDEIDMSWHPEWQRKFIYYINDIIRALDIQEQLNIIITTHSPLILSDMPRNNVILLEKNKQSNTTVIPNIDDTFGANIHDLFNNNFFLGDCENFCTIGEFAKNRIKKIQTELSQQSETNKLLEVLEQINIIGEPIIRTALLKAFNERYKNLDNDVLFVENCKLKRKIETLTRILYETDKY